jgi:hypothetical protein
MPAVLECPFTVASHALLLLSAAADISRCRSAAHCTQAAEYWQVGGA